ncbi:hypothetical protein NDU88_003428 [Pleurodeles waltl]|uniref:Uncharacterized protein n=1 Tax=Pleurodeles waltl TaxID=8319 RepID=A0AAV7LIJ6_PLEWA|nr:hypothetical protein NDU88_003428 [Pleurodeles waltl]
MTRPRCQGGASPGKWKTRSQRPVYRPLSRGQGQPQLYASPSLEADDVSGPINKPCDHFQKKLAGDDRRRRAHLGPFFALAHPVLR